MNSTQSTMIIIAAWTASKKLKITLRRISLSRVTARPNTRAKNTMPAMAPSAAALIGLDGTKDFSHSAMGGEGGMVAAPPTAEARRAWAAACGHGPDFQQGRGGDAPR